MRGLKIVLSITAAAVFATGCWGATGKPAGLGPNALLTTAIDAHQRGDVRAFRTLLGLLIERNPDSEEARVARTLLMAVPPTDTGLTRMTPPPRPLERQKAPPKDDTRSTPQPPTAPESSEAPNR